jgi:mannose-6-phosphate isomerase-like protein (cupin superfamily)
MSAPIPLIRQRAAIHRMDRGYGVVTELFFNGEIAGAGITTGTTILPPGRSVATHTHNCDEQIVILAGQAEAEFDGARHPIGPMEAAFIPEGEAHSFHNVGTEPVLMLFIYAAPEVTRTFTATGETVVHLSTRDMAQPRG